MKKEFDRMPVWKWKFPSRSEPKLVRSDLLTVLDAEYQDRAEGRSNRGFSFGSVYSDHLCILIYYYSVNESMKRLIQELRNVERKRKGKSDNPVFHPQSWDADKFPYIVGDNSISMR